MSDLQKVGDKKEKIVDFLRSGGPNLPVRIAADIGIMPLFASAYLSELYSEKRIKISNMKVGSSPVYYLDGQEEMLENFIEHLNPREREAFHLLKEKKVLNDDEQSPVVRVALRAIKDFAVPLRVNSEKGPKLFWKYFTLPDSEFREKIEKRLSDNSKEESLIGNTDKENLEDEREEYDAEETGYDKEAESSENEGEVKVEDKKAESEKKPAKGREVDREFPNKIKDYVSASDIEVLEVILERKKEIIAKVRTDSIFGKQEFLLIGKDKKNVTDNDLTLALQKAQAERMPALFISPGELNKRAKEYSKQWKNLVKFEKVKF